MGIVGAQTAYFLACLEMIILITAQHQGFVGDAQPD